MLPLVLFAAPLILKLALALTREPARPSRK